MTTNPHKHDHADPTHAHPHANTDGESSSVTRIQRLAMFLEAHFGDVELHMPDADENAGLPEEEQRQPALLVQLDDADAEIDLVTLVRLSHSFSVLS